MTIKTCLGLLVDGLRVATPTNAHNKLHCMFFLFAPSPPVVLWGAGTCRSLALCSVTIKCFGLLVDGLQVPPPMHTTSLTASWLCFPPPPPPPVVLLDASACGSIAFCSVIIKYDFGLLVDNLRLLWLWLASRQSINGCKHERASCFFPVSPPVALCGVGTCGALGFRLLTVESDFGLLVYEICPPVGLACTWLIDHSMMTACSF